MAIAKIAGVLLIIAGALALAYGGFTYTRDREQVDLGPLSLEYQERETIQVPIWAGIGAIAVGTVLILVPRRR